MSSSFHDIRGVLLDMDGTLADTALDLVPLLNGLLREDNMPELDYNWARNHVSQGARALLRLGFGDLSETQEDALLERILTLYSQTPCRHTVLFDGMAELIESLADRNFPWGIVSNKVESLVVAVADALPLPTAPACIIGGDTLSKRKPHPEPLMEAARRIGVEASSCLYLGDDPRDMQAARDAGMMGVIAAFGYIEPGTDLESWGGDAIIQTPQELIGLLD